MKALVGRLEKIACMLECARLRREQLGFVSTL